MRYRETGMPYEEIWDTYFDPVHTLLQLGDHQNICTLLDIGCGYGTFLIPASTLIKGTAIGLDIDETMLQICEQKVWEQGIRNAEQYAVSYKFTLAIITSIPLWDSLFLRL